MGIQQQRVFADKKHYKSLIFAKTKSANDEDFDLKKGQYVGQIDAENLTEFEWARLTSKTWDMGQD